MRWNREKLLKPDLHVYGENGTKIMVYNMKRNPKKEKKKNREKSKFKKDNSKKKNLVLRIRQFWLS